MIAEFCRPAEAGGSAASAAEDRRQDRRAGSDWVTSGPAFPSLHRPGSRPHRWALSTRCSAIRPRLRSSSSLIPRRQWESSPCTAWGQPGTQMDPIPSVPKDLVEFLDKLFPARSPRINDPERQIWIDAGKRACRQLKQWRRIRNRGPTKLPCVCSLPVDAVGPDDQQSTAPAPIAAPPPAPPAPTPPRRSSGTSVARWLPQQWQAPRRSEP